MFDVLSRSGNLHGVLVRSNKNQLIYANTQVFHETGEVEKIQIGMSYELVSGDEAQQVIFESSPGLSDGVDTQAVLSMLIHREESLLSDTPSESSLLVIRAMQMALDALQSSPIIV